MGVARQKLSPCVDATVDRSASARFRACRPSRSSQCNVPGDARETDNLGSHIQQIPNSATDAFSKESKQSEIARMSSFSAMLAPLTAVLLLSSGATANHNRALLQSPTPPGGASGPPLPTINTCPLALTKWITRQDVNGQKIEAATNADSTFDGVSGVFPSVSVARVTLAPCGVRTMHLHQNVDELLIVNKGAVGASIAYANGTICEQTFLNEGDIFLYPRNLIHSARNPSCTDSATVLGVFTAFNSATVNAAASAFNMPGGPFAPYAAAGQVDSIKAASGPSTLSFDPLCLARCNLGAKGGQNPVDALPK